MGSLQSEIEKTLSSWEAPKTTIGTGSIASKTFNFVKEHPTCTSDDVCNALGIDTGRSSATLLSLYQKGKLDRKAYPNPNPDGKRHEVYTYWTAVENFTDKGVDRRPKKAKKVHITRADALRIRAMQQTGVSVNKLLSEEVEAPLEVTPSHKPLRMKQFADEFNPQMFVQDLSLKDARAVYEVLKGYFSG